MPDTVPLDFTENDVPWVTSKFSGAAGALVAEEIELRNCLLRFGCSSEELRVVVARMAGWMDNPPTPGKPIAHKWNVAWWRLIKGQECAPWG